MNQNKFTFESENLVVDFISLKFQYLDSPTMMQIANYLFKLGFNSYQESGKLAKPISEPIQVNSKNKFKVVFRREGPFWDGTLLEFAGLSGNLFYTLIKKELIHWTIFSSAVLSRFDLYYSRIQKSDDKISVTDFLESSHRKLKQTNKNVSFEKNHKGLIFTIGSRASDHFSRIYEGKNFLKFEHEMKGKFLQKYYSLVVENRFQEFEKKLLIPFLIYFGKLLPLYHSDIDWLIVKLRPRRNQQIHQLDLKTDYRNSELSTD